MTKVDRNFIGTKSCTRTVSTQVSNYFRRVHRALRGEHRGTTLGRTKTLLVLLLLVSSSPGSRAWELENVGHFIEVSNKPRLKADEFVAFIRKSEIGWVSKSVIRNNGREVHLVILNLPNARQQDAAEVVSSEMEFDFDDAKKATAFYAKLKAAITNN
ncbi:MAG: hypothetical protein ACJASX_001897 [Limisphaerales bacterium]|jgi:hypothetical protein